MLTSGTISTTAKLPELLKENYTLLQEFIYKNSGIVLGDDKAYLFESRLMPIVRKANLPSINDLCTLLRRGIRPDISRDVIDAMTTNETLFFRDVAPFNAIRETVLPELLERKKATRQLRFWSAASSSGQEAYSLAMMLHEMGLADWRLEIVGTDLSEQMVKRAQTGRYMQIEVNRGLPAPYLVKYFVRNGLEWELRSDIRKNVTFQRFDLRDSMLHLGSFDFVFCRNVLIYFDRSTKKKILDQIGARLNPGGYLILGAAETTLDITDTFQRRLIGATSFYGRG